MDNIKVGIYLQALRKTKGITQSELADILNVSSKTVSKWECGTSLPEIPMLKILSEYYQVLVDDILNGGKIEKENIKEISEKTQEANYKYFYQRNLHKFKMWKFLSFFCLGLSVVGTTALWIISFMAENKKKDFYVGVLFAFFIVSMFITIMSYIACIKMNEDRNTNEKYTKLFTNVIKRYKHIFLIMYFIWLLVPFIFLILSRFD